LVVNKLRGVFNALAVKAPGYGDRRKEMLGDIAVLTGGQVISEDLGLKLDKVQMSMLGAARKIIADKDNTTIIQGKGKSTAIKGRIEQIKIELKKSDSEFDKEKLEERLAKLSGGVGVIRVGAATEAELNYKKLKIENAVAATKAGIAEGIVAGGGAGLLMAGRVLRDLKVTGVGDVPHEIFAGIQIVMRAIEEPLRQIVNNTGKEDGAVVVSEIKEDALAVKKNLGYDALENKLTDMIKAGILDPVKVTRSALQNAASFAGMFLTTEAAVTDLPSEKDETGPAAGVAGGGMPGMGM